MHALQLQLDPSNAERKFLRIDLRRREAKRREYTFYATKAAVLSYSDINPIQALDMQMSRMQMDTHNKSVGMMGTYLVMLMCEDPPAGNLAPFTFRREDLLPYDDRWEAMIMRIINEGVVF